MGSKIVAAVVVAIAAVTVAAGPALAHVGVGPAHGFAHGFGHPIGGLDHVLAMVAVGLWASQAGGRAIWALPLAFMVAMVLAGTVGSVGVGLPLVEFGIAGSVAALGLAIAARIRPPLAIAAVLTALFAIFHGHAHGTEMPAATSGLAYAAGFVLATGLLHAAGLGLGLASGKVLRSPLALRAAGGCIAALGVFLLVG